MSDLVAADLKALELHDDGLCQVKACVKGVLEHLPGKVAIVIALEGFNPGIVQAAVLAQVVSRKVPLVLYSQ